MVQGVGGNHVDIADSSEDESDEETFETEAKDKSDDYSETKTKDLTERDSNSAKILKMDPAEDSLESTSRAETGDQQQQAPSSQYNMDAALSSVGSQPVMSSNMDQPTAHVPVIRPKHSEKEVEDLLQLAVQQSYKATNQNPGNCGEDLNTTNHNAGISGEDLKTSNQNLGISGEDLKTTNQLPAALQNYLAGNNLNNNTDSVKLGSNDKIIPSQNLQINTDSKQATAKGMELDRQDSKSSPAVALVKPMRPKIPSEDGENTEVKELVPTDETNVKTASSVSSGASNSTVNSSTGRQYSPVQLLTKAAASGENEHKKKNASANQNTNTESANSSVFGEPDNSSTEATATNTSNTHGAQASSHQRMVFRHQRQPNPTALFFPNRREQGQTCGQEIQFVKSQGGSSEGFDPATGRFTASESDLEFDMCDSDSFEGAEMSTSSENTRSRSGRRDKMKGDKGCVIS